MHASAVHTPAAVPFAPLTLKSTKLPAATATLPLTVQEVPVAAEHASAVFARFPAAPARSVTVTVFPCCEKTVNSVAVQAAGTQVSTGANSVALELALFTE